jgi:hypothetical protein
MKENGKVIYSKKNKKNKKRKEEKENWAASTHSEDYWSHLPPSLGQHLLIPPNLILPTPDSLITICLTARRFSASNQ